MQSVKQVIRQIKALAEQGEIESALSQCNTSLPNEGEERIEWLRLRAYLYTLKDDLEFAMVDRESIIASGSAALRDYYQIGETALSLGRYREAINWFEKVVTESEKEKENWFMDAALFFLSYAQMRIGLPKAQALASLDRAVSYTPDCGMHLPDGSYWDHNRLRAEINKLNT